jgi:adenylate cyclase
LIKETYDALGEVLLKREATIDRFIGDYVLAMFNTPLPIENPERKACDAALKCKAILSEKQIEWIQRGISDLECRIGIHADVTLIGAIGSDPHLNYTAVGAPVSLTTSLESLNKFYKTSILISDDVYQKVHDYFICRVVDIVRFNGNSENRKPTRCSMTLYELLDYREHRSPEHLILIEKWTLEWKSHCESGDVEGALHCIDEALKIEDYEKDQALLMLKKRCQHYLQNPNQAHLAPTLV